jgi:hypothetical protein
MRQPPTGSPVGDRGDQGHTGRGHSDQAPVYPAVLEELLPAAWHRTDRYANTRVECDHGRLKARLQPMRGVKQDRSVRGITAGHGLVQNVRRGHYQLAVEEPAVGRLAVTFHELALAIWSMVHASPQCARDWRNATPPY